LTNAVSEIVVADNARVSHMRAQRDSGAAFHIVNCAVSLAHASRYQSGERGARRAYFALQPEHAADSEGAECAIDGSR